VLLTRPPLEFQTLVRLACVKHLASVHPEPGSNSLSNFHKFNLEIPVESGIKIYQVKR
jgi:hypothetical protein